MVSEGTAGNSRLVAIAGGLLFIGAVWFIMAISVSESLTSGYSISKEQISGLGSPIFSGMCSTVTDCLMILKVQAPIQSASFILISAAFVLGILGFWGGYLLRKTTRHRRFALAVALSEAGWIFIGLSYLPLYLSAPTEGVVVVSAALHFAGAYVWSLLIMAAAVSTCRFTGAPLKYLSVILAAVALVSFLLMGTGNHLGLGLGGMQRMGVYPLLLWQVGFGAYLTRGLD